MNQALEFEANLDQQLSLFIGAIPVLIPIFRQLNVVGIINRYCPCQADIDEGTVALILALNRLMSPHPLYKVSSWMAETVLQETLDIPAEKLHDRRIGDMLESIYPHEERKSTRIAEASWYIAQTTKREMRFLWTLLSTRG